MQRGDLVHLGLMLAALAAAYLAPFELVLLAYAAGAATGGLEGGPEVGYVGGLVKSAVMGLRSAENIAQS